MALFNEEYARLFDRRQLEQFVHVRRKIVFLLFANDADLAKQMP